MSDGLPTAGPTTELVGRESERARIDDFMVGVPAAPSALAIVGGPGVGKTALWRFAIANARARGFRVLISRPAEEEMPLSGVGLTDLFEGTRLVGLTVGADDPFSTGRAVLGALRDIAGDVPAVLAIDDVHWLDSFSARSLRYALRRLETEPIAVVTTLRQDAARVDPLALASTLPPERQHVVGPGPLHLDDIRRLIGDIGGAISRPTLRRIAEMSAGNPLYALELARALRAKGMGAPADSLPLPESVQVAIGDRVGSHAGDVVTPLEIVSAMGRSSVGSSGRSRLRTISNRPRESAHGVLVVMGVVSGVVSLLAMAVFVLLTGGNGQRYFSASLTVSIALIVLAYLLIFPSFLRLRKTHPGLPRPFRVPGGTATATLVTVAATGWSLLAAVNLLWPGFGTAQPDAALPAGFQGDRLTFELMVFVPLIVVAIVSVVFTRLGQRGVRQKEILGVPGGSSRGPSLVRPGSSPYLGNVAEGRRRGHRE